MNWTKKEILAIIDDPEGYTKVGRQTMANRLIIYKMLQSLYKRQTSFEQESKMTVEDNGVGFNGVDSGFLSDVAERSKEYKQLTIKQTIAVAKRLRKYAVQLESIAQEKIQMQLPVCGYCGVKGHIQSNCSEYLKREFGKEVKQDRLPGMQEYPG